MPKRLTLIERKQQASKLVAITEQLDLAQLLRHKLAHDVLTGPISQVGRLRHMCDLVPEFMILISNVAHQGPINYDGHTRKHTGSDTAESS